MWLCTSTSFLSVVADRDSADRLLVRARREGDIENVFPEAETFTDQFADYLYRAYLPRKRVAEALADAVREIDYPNFKNSVVDHDLHACYLGIWWTMRSLQESVCLENPTYD